ncbi:CBS domain [Geoglobus ahangari]|uniref:CBS domain n=1 Tax=Geoglobus ahangari TaxID=113653 RepID=A0A0F7DBS7_9EURY|nr:CBS domain-containing protein [Geoglobus ahangari]AKG91611.1 CBS domain [Geoglobus ahangari]NOY11007.1 CBS domain-containing protein [Archaeoglobi archaeon]
MRIGDFMQRDVVMVDGKTKVIDVARIMGEKRIGSVIVTRDGEPYGIFTERDFFSKAVLDDGLENAVSNYASTPLITVSPDFSVSEASRIMADMKVRRLVVVEEGKVVGIFTASDLVRALAGRGD